MKIRLEFLLSITYDFDGNIIEREWKFDYIELPTFDFQSVLKIAKNKCPSAICINASY